MKKSQFSRLNSRFPHRDGETMQNHRLPYLISRDTLNERVNELGTWWLGWQTYLTGNFGFEAVWLEIFGEQGKKPFKLMERDDSSPNKFPEGSIQQFPLFWKEEMLGWLCVQKVDEGSAWEEKLVNLLPLMGHGLVQALEWIQLQKANQSLMDQHDGIYESLAQILGLRDHETETHTMRVSKMAMELVQHIQLPVEQWRDVRRGALLHDIGKLGIPDAILLKPGSLTDTERRMMELHVTYGFNILSSITNAPQTLDIVLHHHERWDGTGYPDRLHQDEIPLAARLFAVVDVYDALTTDRPYRTAWQPGRAVEYIKEQAGRQFDPVMVSAFLELRDLSSTN